MQERKLKFIIRKLKQENRVLKKQLRSFTKKYK